MDTNSIIDQIIDWIDTDDQPRANGFEDYFYTGTNKFSTNVYQQKIINKLK